MNRLCRLTGLLTFSAIAWAEPTMIEFRLLTPLSSYGMAPGASFRSVVTAPVYLGGRLLLPSGTVLHGTVTGSVRVGIGLIHERATLDIGFNEYELADGRRFPLTAHLASIDNARESVTAQGRIKGILAASNPQSFVSGLWTRPTADDFVGHSLTGLTGASGRLWTAYSMGPVGAAALFAARLALFRLPEPEIRLPVGTEMTAALLSVAEDAPGFSSPTRAEIPQEISEWVRSQPFLVRKPGGEAVDDIVNLVFMGSREQLLNAFKVAGWSEPDRLTTRSFVRAYKAYTSQAGYAAAPVSKLLYEQDEADVIFQKSLNTIAKRHHVRIWDTEWNGQPAWLGAATQDTGITVNSRAFGFTHSIEPALDLERHKVLRDLEFAGCVESVGYVERDAAIRTSDTRSPIETDGGAGVVWLRDCASPELQTSVPEMPRVPGSKVTRTVRRTLLEVRQYLLRGNAYYWAYRGLRYGHSVATASSSHRASPAKSLLRPYGMTPAQSNGLTSLTPGDRPHD